MNSFSNQYLWKPRSRSISNPFIFLLLNPSPDTSLVSEENYHLNVSLKVELIDFIISRDEKYG